MTSFYSVVQFVPDPIIDERLNIGVVVFGNGIVRTRFIDNWKQVTAILPAYADFIRDFTSRCSDMDETTIQSIGGRWINPTATSIFAMRVPTWYAAPVYPA